jgi:hypothetical protein
MGLFVAVVVAVMVIARIGRNRIPPFAPPVIPAVAQENENALDANADQVNVSGSDTRMIKTFALTPGSKFSIKNISGSISIESWDQPKAQVIVTKRGPDRGGRVFFSNSANSLSLRTGMPGGSNNGQDFRYEVKIPREMGRIDLQSTNGSVKLSNVNGQIFVQSANGTIELNDVAGVSKIQTANGKITATLSGPSDGPMEFLTTNGKIDVTIKCDFDAELDASTIQGTTNIDEQLGIPVVKEMVGQHARGQLGSGGPPLKLTAINGSVKLSKQCPTEEPK